MYLGFDTSNYTTSVAVFDGREIQQAKKLLEVKQGKSGLRQSECVFQHTVNLPELVESLAYADIDAVGVSARPRNVAGSYMPCFLVGMNVARSVSAVNGIPLFETSHQAGHILASLYSVNRLDLIHREFIAFHLSGGTTEALLVKPDCKEMIKADIISASTDLKAGQAIDRTGVMLDMKFPCGKELDELASSSNAEFKIRPTMLDMNCSLSGVENKVKKMIESKERREDIAKFALSYVAETVSSMLSAVLKEYGEMPVVFSGGVSSNSLLRKIINERYEAYFAKPEFSLDNAAGTAIYAYLKSNN